MAGASILTVLSGNVGLFRVCLTKNFVTCSVPLSECHSGGLRMWHVAGMGEKNVAHVVLAGKPKGKGNIGRTDRRWERNVKMDFQEIG